MAVPKLVLKLLSPANEFPKKEPKPVTRVEYLRKQGMDRSVFEKLLKCTQNTCR